MRQTPAQSSENADPWIVITGFNSDIEYAGVVYHVQTEDKGLESPLILSLVYAGGAILASKRTPYEDLIVSGFDETILAERLQRQHRLICAAINAGRIEELKRMGARTAEEPADGSGAARESQSADVASQSVSTSAEPHEFVFEDLQNYQPPPQTFTDDTQEVVRPPQSEPPVSAPPAAKSRGPKPRARRPPIKPAPAVEVSPAPAALDADDSISEAAHDVPAKEVSEAGPALALSLLDEADFVSGHACMIRILVEDRSGESPKALVGVTVSVKILGTNFRPQMYSVKSQRDGMAVVSAEMPRFTSGRAAVLIRADNKGESTELRRVIHPAAGG